MVVSSMRLSALKRALWSARFLWVALLLPVWSSVIAAERPNVLWITVEDMSPQLGCYGDAYADTPNIDALAAKGMIYNSCWSVCLKRGGLIRVKT